MGTNNDNESDIIKPFIKLRKGVTSEDVHYSIVCENIPEEFRDVALKELNETEENKRKGLLKLRNFLKGKSISDVDDYTLLFVLRNCKYDIKKSEKKLMAYLQTQDMITNWLQTADLSKLETVLNHNVIGILPYRDKYGRVIFYTYPNGVDLESYDLDDAALCSYCLLFYALSFPLTSVVGLAYIGDCKAPSLSILYPVAKTFRHHLFGILDSPFRIAKVDFINENFIARMFYNITKSFVPSKLVKRITFHGSDLQGLQDFYHPAILPEQFGGTMQLMNSKELIDNLLNFIKKLKSRNLYLCNA